MDRIKKLNLLSTLIVTKGIKEDIVLKNFLAFFKLLSNNSSEDEVFASYGNFVSSLEEAEEKDFSKYLKKLFYQNHQITNNPNDNFKKELNILFFISRVTFEDIKTIFRDKFSSVQEIFEFLPEYENSNTDFNAQFVETDILCDNIFSKSEAFIFDTDLEVKPVEFSENIMFSNLKGYKEQKKILYENTSSFLEGKKVNNILLYGDAGCGKSSTIRALLNEFKGLKMIQIFKNNLINLDKLFKKLKKIPYKFIIFADDISFDDNDETFSTMKAILEGSLIQCPENAVIYATSNRRHLVRENFKSREGDEIHLNDTINELNSLSERFGINILFQKPTMDEYISIVLELAIDNNIDIDKDCLIEKAKKTAVLKGSTSPRTAKQLIDNILACVSV